MPQASRCSLADLVTAIGDLRHRFIADDASSIRLDAATRACSGRELASAFGGSNVLLRTERQIASALWLVALDNIARRIVIWPPGLDLAHLPYVLSAAAIDVVISEDLAAVGDVGTLGQQNRQTSRATASGATEWVLFTSGTTGVPKMVVHTLETLIGPLEQIRSLGAGAVWSTFYDIRRYGGLQILLRALVAGGSMVLSSRTEAPSEFVGRLAREGVSHISGTPSHWRSALMSTAAGEISPRYVRMSGEVADQAIIDKLRVSYPRASVSHAFASTEAGLVFEVDDGRAGFPASLVDEQGRGPALKVVDGSLRVQSTRTALRYLGDNAPPLKDKDGYVDTGDMLELRGDRYYFAGRREGTINVGGLKAHPEEIEAVINHHHNVQMSLVKGRRSPITGAIVIAHVVPRSPVSSDGAERLKMEILELCRASLAPYKVPTDIHLVTGLDIDPSGKLVRARA